MAHNWKWEHIRSILSESQSATEINFFSHSMIHCAHTGFFQKKVDPTCGYLRSTLSVFHIGMTRSENIQRFNEGNHAWKSTCAHLLPSRRSSRVSKVSTSIFRISKCQTNSSSLFRVDHLHRICFGALTKIYRAPKWSMAYSYSFPMVFTCSPMLAYMRSVAWCRPIHTCLPCMTSPNTGFQFHPVLLPPKAAQVM